MNNLLKIITGVFLLLSFYSSNAQKITVQDISVEKGEQISFSCRIEEKYSQREKYDIAVFTSADQYQTPVQLNEPSDNLESGKPYIFSFSGKKQLNGFVGDLRLKIKAEASLFPLHITKYPKNNKAKRGKSINLEWSDYLENQNYRVELYREDEIINTLSNNTDKSSLVWKIPKKLKPGKNYELKVYPVNAMERYADPVPLTIKRKVPLGLVIVPLAGAIGVGSFVLTSGGESSDSGEGLPDPPDPPE